MNPYILLAKTAVENYIKTGEIISLSANLNLPEEFLKLKAGVFVTIEKDGELRGCIGTYLPLKNNIAEEIIYNALAAATEDHRFGRLHENELPKLSYAVYILSEPELVEDIAELNPKKYGVIIKTIPVIAGKSDVVFNGCLPYKSGLLLPDLEGIDTIERQISIACQKGGIDPQTEKIMIYRFAAEKYD